ncbi:hypothetical protein TNCV_3491641 [Trichonephila clavipes]|nr:hypothetical protein TNCV_3491641 [Trichonephila clavipes]
MVLVDGPGSFELHTDEEGAYLRSREVQRESELNKKSSNPGHMRTRALSCRYIARGIPLRNGSKAMQNHIAQPLIPTPESQPGQQFTDHDTCNDENVLFDSDSRAILFTIEPPYPYTITSILNCIPRHSVLHIDLKNRLFCPKKSFLQLIDLRSPSLFGNSVTVSRRKKSVSSASELSGIWVWGLSLNERCRTAPPPSFARRLKNSVIVSRRDSCELHQRALCEDVNIRICESSFVLVNKPCNVVSRSCGRLLFCGSDHHTCIKQLRVGVDVWPILDLPHNPLMGCWEPTALIPERRRVRNQQKCRLVRLESLPNHKYRC